MFEFYNPHPQQKIVGDCVKRALTKASGKTYQEVSNELNRIKREKGASSYASNPVWRAYVENNLKGISMSFPAEKGKPRMNGRRFCEAYPKGVYILRMAKHLSCCVDGIIYDTWDCLECCVYGAYEIPQEPKLMPMPGIDKFPEFIESINEEKAASAGPELHSLSGQSIIAYFSNLLDAKVKLTKKSEPWISLDPSQYKIVRDTLLLDERFKSLQWETKRGATKSTIFDPKTGMTLILKREKNAYIWITNNGK